MADINRSTQAEMGARMLRFATICQSNRKSPPSSPTRLHERSAQSSRALFGLALRLLSVATDLPSPPLCDLSLPCSRAFVGTRVTVSVTLLDVAGYPLAVSATDSPSTVDVEVVKMMGAASIFVRTTKLLSFGYGRLMTTFVPDVPGRYVVRATARGQALRGSPIEVDVSDFTDVSVAARPPRVRSASYGDSVSAQFLSVRRTIGALDVCFLIDATTFDEDAPPEVLNFWLAELVTNVTTAAPCYITRFSAVIFTDVPTRGCGPEHLREVAFSSDGSGWVEKVAEAISQVQRIYVITILHKN